MVPIPAGSLVKIDVPGLHYNRKNHLVQRFYSGGLQRAYAARYWGDPHAFNPKRFMSDWDKDAFIPFSGGARACIGRG